MKPEPAIILDIRSMGAPWAMLKVTQAMRGLAPGEVLQVLASDPALERDMPQVVAAAGGMLSGLERTAEGTCFWFQYGGEPQGSSPWAGRPSQPKEERDV